MATCQPCSRSSRDSARSNAASSSTMKTVGASAAVMAAERTGSCTQNTAPPSAALRELRQPRWASAIERQMARPMPMPPSLVLQNGSKTLCRSASAMPGPRSATQIATWPSVRAVLTVRRRSANGVPSIASAALTIRFSSSCCSCTRSPSTGGSSVLSSTDTATWRVSRFVRVRSSVSRTSSLTSSGTSVGSPRLNSAPRRRMTSAARWSSATMSSQISRSSARSTGSRCSIFCAASALLRIEASGWFSWCAIDADNWPSSDTRVMWRNAARSSSACISARLRGVMSSATPSRCCPPPCAARPRAAIQRVCPSGVATRYSTSISSPLASARSTACCTVGRSCGSMLCQHLLEVGERVGQVVGAAP